MFVSYLEKHKLINHTHHGSIHGKGTQTLVQEMYSRFLESLEKGEDSACIQLDQSKVYNAINHIILLEKMKILGLNKKPWKYSPVT